MAITKNQPVYITKDSLKHGIREFDSFGDYENGYIHIPDNVVPFSPGEWCLNREVAIERARDVYNAEIERLSEVINAGDLANTELIRLENEGMLLNSQ